MSHSSRPRLNIGAIREKSQSRSPSGLPIFSSAVQEKLHARSQSTWTTSLYLPIPGISNRRLRLPVPNLPWIHSSAVSKFGRRRGSVVVLVGLAFGLFLFYSLVHRIGGGEAPSFMRDPSTLVYSREDLQKIWKWEVESGHYPSRREIPKEVGFATPPSNPALPPPKSVKPSQLKNPAKAVTETIGHGPNRMYIDIQADPSDIAYPPRPIPGSIADLDVIMDHCDFGTGKFVRDCLEVLRMNGGLDNGIRLSVGPWDDMKYIYTEEDLVGQPAAAAHITAKSSPSNLSRKPSTDLEPPLALPAPVKYRPYNALSIPCDPENPRIFHMFWAGPFTDKPYMALLSFLFTQNLHLHLHEDDPDAMVCRPRFWLWINPGAAGAVANSAAVHDMFERLKSNPWASPFLHPRFKDIISFKLWNTTEQLDGVPELKEEWRSYKHRLFTSGGVVEGGQADEEPEKEGKNRTDSQVGSSSATEYDRKSVILSDIARFVLTHRFGGVYLDADMIILRDWEELWGYKGAFAYRWSYHQKYNTAVFRMNAFSSLGSFIFRTALKNGFDFHPMIVSKYLKDAYLQNLLYRLPDALFDPAWLNTEGYQLERPPQPFIKWWTHFFDSPSQQSAGPRALGYEGFFRGAYAYHYHNNWWNPFDPVRNWPDLGDRFVQGERLLRLGADVPTATTATTTEQHLPPVENVMADKRDLDWSTVLKRTFEAYIRGERPNMYGEWLLW